MASRHPVGEKNKKLVLEAMDSLQRKDIGRNVSPKEIMNQIKGKLHYRTIMRQLDKLIDEGSVIRMDRGEYCTRATIEKRSEREQAFRSILSISRQNLRGIFKTTEWGRPVSETPANPLTYSDAILDMAREIVEKRLKSHGDKELAEKEADIWLACLLNNICVELGSTGSPFEVVPGRFVTTIRQELPVRLLGSLMSKQFVDRKMGHDVLIFQEAVQIVKQGLIDLTLIMEQLREPVIYAWENMRKWVYWQREQIDTPEVWANFEYLYDEIRKIHPQTKDVTEMISDLKGTVEKETSDP